MYTLYTLCAVRLSDAKAHLTGWYSGIVIIVHIVIYLLIEQLRTWQILTFAFQYLISSVACIRAGRVCVYIYPGVWYSQRNLTVRSTANIYFLVATA